MRPVDPLKYQSPDRAAVAMSLGMAASPELLTVKLRYKQPDGETSKLLERAFVDQGARFASAAPDFKFAAAVAEYGMILRDSEQRGTALSARWSSGRGKGKAPMRMVTGRGSSMLVRKDAGD